MLTSLNTVAGVDNLLQQRRSFVGESLIDVQVCHPCTRRDRARVVRPQHSRVYGQRPFEKRLRLAILSLKERQRDAKTTTGRIKSETNGQRQLSRYSDTGKTNVTTVLLGPSYLYRCSTVTLDNSNSEGLSTVKASRNRTNPETSRSTRLVPAC